MQGGGDDDDDDKLLEKPKEYAVSFSFPSSSDDRPTIAVLDAGYTIPAAPSASTKTCVSACTPNLASRWSVRTGAGKSTLLGLLGGRLQPDAGEVQRDRRLVLGRYDQHFDELLPVGENIHAAKHLEDSFGLSSQDARKLLGRAGLESNAHLTPVSRLSGGQKSRVVFAQLAATKANVLVLDEPTNHLDIESVEALVEGLNAFEGGLVVSTHDARLVEGLDECEVWVCGEGRRRAATPDAGRVREIQRRRRRGGGESRRGGARQGGVEARKGKEGEKVTERRVGAETRGEPRGMPHSSRTVRE